MKRYLALGVLALAPVAYAQELKLTVFDRLKDKAKEVVDMNMPEDLINTGRAFLPDDVKKATSGMRSLVIKSLEFDKEGVYTDADVKQLTGELGAPGWKLIISTDEKNEKARIWMKATGNGELGGMRILSAEARELTVVVIEGKIQPEDLNKLGALGLPHIFSEHGSSDKKKDEE